MLVLLVLNLLFVFTSILIFAIFVYCIFFFFQAEDGIRDLVRSRGLGDVYKRQVFHSIPPRLLRINTDIDLPDLNPIAHSLPEFIDDG